MLHTDKFTQNSHAGSRGFESCRSREVFHLEPGLVARTATQSFGARLRIALFRSFLTAIFTW